ncbi:MAG: tryptophan--tRNA ligase, partial [Candidatus Latescibacteria bacterium]|nr:tryptophan--tRNA ligase [Candidatus Latescibacterota bacterium]
ARDLGLIQKDEEITSINYGLLGYPVLQAADILIYKADAVPVGEDQVPHIELTRQIARRFNHLYKKVFPEPEALLTKVARLPGLDGNKMSKSQGNVIYLSDSPDVIREKIKTMFTDPQKVYRTDPGDPEVRGCPAFAYHKIYNTSETEQIEADCKQAKLGCVNCKQLLAERLVEALQPIKDERAKIVANPKLVGDVLEKGKEEAKEIAKATMDEVRHVMGLEH